MMGTSFFEQLNTRWGRKLFLCVGLDPVVEKIPKSVKKDSLEQTIINFNTAIVDATAPYVCAFKPNSAFYEAYGSEGISTLKQTVDYIKQKYPEIPVILDAKRGDIESTNDGYVKFAFEYLNADAITLHPYLGKQALDPFLKKKDRGIFILVKTSNKGSGEFQDLPTNGQPLYLQVVKHITETWNENCNCGVVVGATYPEELKQVRAVLRDMPILIPGIGAQGGDITQTIKSGKNSKGEGMIINSSRGIIYASSGTDFAEAAGKAAKDLHEQILNAFNNE